MSVAGFLLRALSFMVAQGVGCCSVLGATGFRTSVDRLERRRRDRGV